VEYYRQNATSCHWLSMRLNCLTGLTSGIAGIAKKWLIICTFLLLGPLCHVFPCSTVLALGQRTRRCLFYMLYIITPYIIVLDGQFLIVSAHRCSGLLLATVSPSYCLTFVIVYIRKSWKYFFILFFTFFHFFVKKLKKERSSTCRTTFLTSPQKYMHYYK